MPHLVARQWHVLKPASAIVGIFGRSQWHRMRPLVARSPSFSQGTLPDRKVFREIVPPQNSAIIIPVSVPNTQPADIVRLVKPVPPKLLRVDPFCVILLTPSFSPWLLKDDTFLRDVLLKAYSKLRMTTQSSPPRIKALCAVVNKLPSGRAFEPRNELRKEVLKRAREALVDETGFEGIAYATFPVTASVPSSVPSHEDEGAIDFILDGPAAARSGNTQVVRVPLANTIFQTGTVTTMTFSVWELSHGPQRLELLSKSRVSHHGVRIATRNPAADDIVSTLSIPALPLTMPRRIEGCLGNIIRQIRLGPEDNAVTASSELEKTVPLYFKSRGEPAQATTAWALIIPAAVSEKAKRRTGRILTNSESWKDVDAESKNLPWERFWESNPPETNTLISAALAEGARLHRVLSGGGGWGKKAGLLSLDPVPSSGATIHSDAEGSTSPHNEPRDLASALTPVAQIGDFIQFFISSTPKTGAGVNQSTGLERLMALPKDNTWGWELGTIPSTIDSTSDGLWQQTTTDSQEIAVFRNTFGVLAEGGLTITRKLAKKGTEPPSTSTGTSVVDVPFSRFWAVELKEMDAPSTIPMHESEERIHFRADPMPRHLSDPLVTNSDEALIAGSFHLHSKFLSRVPTYQSQQTVTKLASDLQIDGDTIFITPPGGVQKLQIHRVVLKDAFSTRRNPESRQKLRIRRITTGDLTSDRDFASRDPVSEEKPQVRRVVSEDLISDRETVRIDPAWRLASKRARGIEGMIKRLRLETSAILSAGRLGSGSKSRPKQALKTGTEVRLLADEIVPTTVRKIGNDQLFGSRVARDRLHQIRLAVRKLKQEHRVIMGAIHQDEREARNVTTLEPAQYQLFRDTSPAVGDNKRLTGTLERDIELIHSTPLPERFFSPIAYQFSRIQVDMNTAQTELGKLLQWVSLRAHIIHTANKFALGTYGLNIELRWQLGRMIRNRLLRRSGLRSEIPYLESRIFVLRDYHNNLLSNRPGITEQQVKKHLIARELSSPVQRRLGQRMNDKNEPRNQVEASRPLRLHSKFRKTFHTPLVRIHITRQPLVRRRALRNSRRRSVTIRRHTSLGLSSEQVHSRRRQNDYSLNHTTLRSRGRRRVFSRDMLQLHTTRKRKEGSSSIRAKERAAIKRREELASRVDSWLRGAIFAPGDSILNAERQGVDGARPFGMGTRTSSDLEKGQKGDEINPLLDTAVREHGSRRRRRRR